MSTKWNKTFNLFLSKVWISPLEMCVKQKWYIFIFKHNILENTILSWWYLLIKFLSLLCPSVSPWVGLMLNAVVSPLPPVWLLQLLDLCVLHMNSLDFQYRVLAASVLSHFIQQEAVEKVTGKSWDYHVCRNVNMNLKNMFNVWFHGLNHSEVTWLTSWKHAYIYIYISIYFFSLCSGLSKDAIQPCVNWMAPFVESVGCFGRAMLKDFVKVKTEDKHNIQTHTDYMAMLVSVFLSYLRLYFTLNWLMIFWLRDLLRKTKSTRIFFLCLNVPLS